MSMDSILVVNMNYLGDALMTTPAIRALKLAFPGAVIDVIAGSTANYGALEILSLVPDIDRLIPRADGGSLARGIQLFRIIVKGSYGLVVILPSLPFYTMIARLTGRRVVTVPRADESKHMADHMLDGLSLLLPSVTGPRSLVMEVPIQAAVAAKDLLGGFSESVKLVALNVGASRPQKRWPAAHFAAVANIILERGLNLVLLGGDNDQDRATGNEINQSLEHFTAAAPPRIVDLIGKTTLEQLSAVIERMDVLVTCDTGAMHIASGLGVPVVALFGSTNAHFTGPYGSDATTRILDLRLSCAPCGTHPTCGGRYQCMSGIRPEQVLESILDVLAASEKSAACRTL